MRSATCQARRYAAIRAALRSLAAALPRATARVSHRCGSAAARGVCCAAADARVRRALCARRLQVASLGGANTGAPQPDGRPCAELWLGTHPSGPATLAGALARAPRNPRLLPLTELRFCRFAFSACAARRRRRADAQGLAGGGARGAPGRRGGLAVGRGPPVSAEGARLQRRRSARLPRAAHHRLGRAAASPRAPSAPAAPPAAPQRRHSGATRVTCAAAPLSLPLITLALRSLLHFPRCRCCPSPLRSPSRRTRTRRWRSASLRSARTCTRRAFAKAHVARCRLACCVLPCAERIALRGWRCGRTGTTSQRWRWR
jgi:hypothetical protein